MPVQHTASILCRLKDLYFKVSGVKLRLTLRVILRLGVNTDPSTDWPRSPTVHVCPDPPCCHPSMALCEGLGPLLRRRGSASSL